jgi:hypothetical protein
MLLNLISNPEISTLIVEILSIILAILLGKKAICRCKTKNLCVKKSPAQISDSQSNISTESILQNHNE